MSSERASDRPDAAGEPPPPYEPLQDALTRAVTTRWWRRWLRHRSDRPWWQQSAVLAAAGVVVVLSAVAIVAPWSGSRGAERDRDAFGPAGSVLQTPTDAPADPRSVVSRPEAGRTAGPDCQSPLSVVVAPDLAGAVQELAQPLLGGDCPKLAITAETPAATLNTLAAGGGSPDVWIPDSTLWLRLADDPDLPDRGTSVARTPVVLAVPPPVADQFEREGAWPVWLVFYDKVTSGAIPRMSMPPPESTAGALTLVAFAAAAEYHWGDDGEGAPFLRMIDFRNHLATTDADPEALLNQLATTPAAESDTRVGVFPVTEQRLLAYLDRGPATPAVAFGTHEAMSEADYPMAISQALDDRLAGIADELRAQLRSPAAVQRLAELGFRPPRGEQLRPAALTDTNRFPDYPDPVSLPDPAGWQQLVDGWRFQG
ncbi:MAG TPA: substrate-binding domain-containing protein [Natronosporangium sp.]